MFHFLFPGSTPLNPTQRTQHRVMLGKHRRLHNRGLFWLHYNVFTSWCWFLWHNSCGWRALGTVNRKQTPWEWIQPQSQDLLKAVCNKDLFLCHSGTVGIDELPDVKNVSDPWDKSSWHSTAKMSNMREHQLRALNPGFSENSVMKCAVTLRIYSTGEHFKMHWSVCFQWRHFPSMFNHLIIPLHWLQCSISCVPLYCAHPCLFFSLSLSIQTSS